ncbi:hypothetical protein BDZ97DRAFT_1768455, partial [Flammula alnicola]
MYMSRYVAPLNAISPGPSNPFVNTAINQMKWEKYMTYPWFEAENPSPTIHVVTQYSILCHLSTKENNLTISLQKDQDRRKARSVQLGGDDAGITYRGGSRGGGKTAVRNDQENCNDGGKERRVLHGLSKPVRVAGTGRKPIISFKRKAIDTLKDLLSPKKKKTNPAKKASSKKAPTKTATAAKPKEVAGLTTAKNTPTNKTPSTSDSTPVASKDSSRQPSVVDVDDDEDSEDEVQVIEEEEEASEAEL